MHVCAYAPIALVEHAGGEHARDSLALVLALALASALRGTAAVLKERVALHAWEVLVACFMRRHGFSIVGFGLLLAAAAIQRSTQSAGANPGIPCLRTCA